MGYLCSWISDNYVLSLINNKSGLGEPALEIRLLSARWGN